MNFMKCISAAALALSVSFTGASAWENVKEMNEQIDQTNFIVRGGCSGTLVDVENRLIVTAHHCMKGFIKQVTRDVIGKDGKVKKVTFERLLDVPVSQNDYHDFENVGTVTYQTRIVAYKQERDLAILQLIGDNLRSTMAAPMLPEGEKVYRGEPVTAVGNPLGYDATVTTGVVSSTTRTFQVPWALNEMVPLIQFDANVNGGNSGGALYDSKGRFIGIVIAGVRGSDLSFAIPVYEVHPVINQLIYDLCIKADEPDCLVKDGVVAIDDVDDTDESE
jgi:S1-C subfamily serine protease